MLFIAITFFCFCLVFVCSTIHFLKTTSVFVGFYGRHNELVDSSEILISMVTMNWSSFLSLITNKTNTWLYYVSNKVCVFKRNRNCLPSVNTWDHIDLFGAICVALLLSFLCSVFCSVSLSSIYCVYMHWLSILGYNFGFSVTFFFQNRFKFKLDFIVRIALRTSMLTNTSVT